MRFYLHRLRINSGGYDRSGSYWGLGNPLYQYESEADTSGTIRARNRAHAKQVVSEMYPSLCPTFFR